MRVPSYAAESGESQISQVAARLARSFVRSIDRCIFILVKSSLPSIEPTSFWYNQPLIRVKKKVYSALCVRIPVFKFDASMVNVHYGSMVLTVSVKSIITSVCAKRDNMWI